MSILSSPLVGTTQVTRDTWVSSLAHAERMGLRDEPLEVCRRIWASGWRGAIVVLPPESLARMAQYLEPSTLPGVEQ